jgi:hypothetical protein
VCTQKRRNSLDYLLVKIHSFFSLIIKGLVLLQMTTQLAPRPCLQSTLPQQQRVPTIWRFPVLTTIQKTFKGALFSLIPRLERFFLILVLVLWEVGQTIRALPQQPSTTIFCNWSCTYARACHGRWIHSIHGTRHFFCFAPRKICERIAIPQGKLQSRE